MARAFIHTRDESKQVRDKAGPSLVSLLSRLVSSGAQLDVNGRISYHSGMKTIVSEKGQITIPKPLRVRLGIRKGQVLEVKEERGRLVMTKQKLSRDPFEEYFGVLKLGRSTDEIMKELRGGEYPRKW
jgi:antitoxin PrlF